jgi:hypothetical protein
LASLKIGGFITFNILGERDEWSYHHNMTFLTEAEIRVMLEDLCILDFVEVERDGPLASGGMKYWHYFDVLACREVCA